MKRRWLVFAKNKNGYIKLVGRFWFEESAKRRARRGNSFFYSMGWVNDPWSVTYVVERDES